MSVVLPQLESIVYTMYKSEINNLNTQLLIPSLAIRVCSVLLYEFALFK